jgi:hypothetical protein
MLGVLAAIALMQCGPDGPVYSCPTTMARSRAFLAGAPFALSAQCAGTLPLAPFGTVSLTRASSAFCPKSDGTFVSVASDVPRVGRLGLLVEPATSQLLANVRDLSNASWTKTTMSCTKTATGADGSASGASTCTASAGNGTAIQALVLGSAQRAASISLKRRTGTGTVEVTMDNGATWCNATAPLATAMANGCTWLRYQQYGDDWHDTAQVCVAGCGAMTQTIANPSVGIRLGTNGDAVDVDFAQLEARPYATSPMNGTTRAVDVPIITPNGTWPVTAGIVEMKVTPQWIINAVSVDFAVPFDGRAGGGLGDAQFAYLLHGNGTLTHGVRNNGAGTQATTTLATTSAWVGDILFGAPRLWRLEWASNNLRFRLNGVTKLNTVGAVNLPASQPVAVRLGQLYDNSLSLLGYVSDVRVATSVLDDTKAVATIGDSILRGAYDVYVASAIQARVSSRRVYVSPYAVSGDSTVGCTTQYASVSSTDTDVIVNNCGINNLLGGESAAVAWGNMQTLLDSMYAAGFRIVAVNLLPCAGYASCTAGVQANVTTVNASLASWVASHSTKATLVDANTLLRNPLSIDALKASCADESGADFLHPDNSCAIEYAQAIAGAL